MIIPFPSQIAPGHASADWDGRPMLRFTGSYQLGGRTFTAEFVAYTEEEGRRLGEEWGLDDIGLVVGEGAL